MMIPVRCFTCGTVVASSYETYASGMESGMDSQEALDATKLSRFCCRRMLVAHAPLIGDAAPYE